MRDLWEQAIEKFESDILDHKLSRSNTAPVPKFKAIVPINDRLLQDATADEKGYDIEYLTVEQTEKVTEKGFWSYVDLWHSKLYLYGFELMIAMLKLFCRLILVIT